ncbi:MAG: histidine kinase [Acidobacteriota bacterium]
MNPHWQQYWAEMRRYMRYGLLAPLVALLPFLLNLSYWQQRGGLWVGLVSSLFYGTIIGVVIFLCFSSVYAALTWILIRTGKFYHPPVLVQIILGSFGAVTGMWLVSFGRSFLLGRSEKPPEFLPLLIFSGSIATAFSLFFAYRKAREEALALRAESAEASLHVLEQQMRPHFLFNALNSLAELIESGQGNAAEITYKLSDLYRRILANSGAKTSSLSSELEIVRDYLELEQLRFGDRLKFEIRAPENAGEIFLPSLMLQTLVENAIKHGVAPAVEGGQVVIEIGRGGGKGYQLSVANTGSPLQPNKNLANNGTGLANTRARLDLLYGNRHGFELRRDDQGRTVASFHFAGERIG